MSKREDPLKDSWAYQEIWQEGFQHGLQKAAQEIAQGHQTATLRWQRELLERVVQLYFLNLVEMAKKRGNAIDDPDVLQELILELARVQNVFRLQMEEEARKILSK